MVSKSDDIVRYDIEISELAIKDIEAIYAFLVSNADIHVAGNQGNMIFDHINNLGIFPNGNPAYEPFPIMRIAHVGKYQIFYQVDNEERVVTIARIFHSHQNINLKNK